MKLTIIKNSAKKRSVIKKQLLLLGVSLFVMVFILSVGFMLSKNVNSLSTLEFLPEKNNPFLVTWRVFFYSFIIALLTPRSLTWIPFMQSLSRVNKSLLLRCRYIALISIVIYECVIVQNVLGLFIQWVINDVS